MISMIKLMKNASDWCIHEVLNISDSMFGSAKNPLTNLFFNLIHTTNCETTYRDLVQARVQKIFKDNIKTSKDNVRILFGNIVFAIRNPSYVQQLVKLIDKSSIEEVHKQVLKELYDLSDATVDGDLLALINHALVSIILNDNISEDLRKEALLQLIEHTEGFINVSLCENALLSSLISLNNLLKKDCLAVDLKNSARTALGQMLSQEPTVNLLLKQFIDSEITRSTSQLKEIIFNVSDKAAQLLIMQKLEDKDIGTKVIREENLSYIAHILENMLLNGVDEEIKKQAFLQLKKYYLEAVNIPYGKEIREIIIRKVVNALKYPAVPCSLKQLIETDILTEFYSNADSDEQSLIRSLIVSLQKEQSLQKWFPRRPLFEKRPSEDRSSVTDADLLKILQNREYGRSFNAFGYTYSKKNSLIKI